MSSKLAKLGLVAFLAYGIFDGVTYTSFFVLAILGYEKCTGKNPAANLQALLGECLIKEYHKELALYTIYCFDEVMELVFLFASRLGLGFNSKIYLLMIKT
ncbi:unnamed protein product [Fraxinus pennsylvanica]|uniref:Uncharacterized protein n=1 Tax=Fraxinus pennsylvanica TaxID=56036 RepID=A0AAD2A9X7_9LAMI|nr:unnamed protein product [Fraxinus pennsylvanica]